MKKTLIFLLVLTANLAIAQRTTITDKLIVKQSFEVNGRTVTEIMIDTSLTGASNSQLPTASTVKAYVDNRLGSAGSGAGVDTMYLRNDTLFLSAPPNLFFVVLPGAGDMNSAYASGAGGITLTTVDSIVGSVTITPQRQSSRIAVVARANFLKDSGTTRRIVTTTLTTSAGTQLGQQNVSRSQNIASSEFPIAVHVFIHTHNTLSPVVYQIRARADAASAAISDDWEISAIELTGAKGEQGEQGVPGGGLDSVVLVQDSILVSYTGGVEVARDTIVFPDVPVGIYDTLSDLRADLIALSAAKLDTTLANAQIFVGNSNNKAQGRTLSGDATLSNTGVLTLGNSGVSAGSYGSATQVPTITFDAKGRATAASNTNITGLLSGLTTNRIPVATGATALGDGYFLQDANGTTLDATKYFRQTGGTTLQRPVGSAGMEWYNTDLNTKQQHNGTGWNNNVVVGSPASGYFPFFSGTNGVIQNSVMLQVSNNEINFLNPSPSGASLYGARIKLEDYNNQLNGDAGISIYGADNSTISTTRSMWIRSGQVYFPANIVSETFIRFTTTGAGAGISFPGGGAYDFAFKSINSIGAGGGTNILNGTSGQQLSLFVGRTNSGFSSVNELFLTFIKDLVLPHDTILTIFQGPVQINTSGIVGNASLIVGENRTPGLTYALNVTSPRQSRFQGNIGIGADPTQKLHVVGNMRLTGDLYDSTNDAGSTGERLRKVSSGTFWRGHFGEYGRYTANQGTISPQDGDILMLDSDAGAGGWTQNINPQYLCSGCFFRVIVDAVDTKEITLDSTTGGFFFGDFGGAADATLLLDESGTPTVYELSWNGTDFIVYKIGQNN